jgi:hypothetical protein
MHSEEPPMIYGNASHSLSASSMTNFIILACESADSLDPSHQRNILHQWGVVVLPLYSADDMCTPTHS